MLKKFEKKIRAASKQLAKDIFGSRRGRRQHLNAMSDDVVEVTRQLADHRITFNPHDGIGKHLYASGAWDRGVTEKVISLLFEEQLTEEGSGVIELGANIGTQTIYMHLSKRFERIIAVEADPYNADVLNRNIHQNDFEAKTSIMDCAIGEVDGAAILFKKEGNQGGHSLVAQNGKGDEIEVQTKTLATILRDAKVNPVEIGFVWCDLEGYEFEALRQIVEVLGTSVPVYTEFSPGFYGDEKTASFLDFICENYASCYQFLPKQPPVLSGSGDIPASPRQFDILLFNKT